MSCVSRVNECKKIPKVPRALLTLLHHGYDLSCPRFNKGRH
jgi:hypothetical protein